MDPVRLGRTFRALRIRLQRRQIDVSAVAGVARSTVQQIETGDLRRTTIGDLVDAVAALGAELDIRIRWHGEGLDRLLDEAHAQLVDTFVARLRRWDWECAIEVSFNFYGERGSVDILAWHAVRRAVLICEIKSIVADAQGTIAPVDRKTRLARRIAQERGWDPISISRLLVIGDSTTSRRRVARVASVFEAAFPDRGSALRQWLRDPGGPMGAPTSVSGLLFLPYASGRGRSRPAAARERVRRPR
jgi:transcriptional regulator with XRE-family HTH domain